MADSDRQVWMATSNNSFYQFTIDDLTTRVVKINMDNFYRLIKIRFDRKTNHHWFRLWFVAWLAPSHPLNQCWNSVNTNLRDKFQWNRKQNSHIFIQENTFEKIVCEMAAILPRPHCVKGSGDTMGYLGLCCQKQVSQAGISNYIPQFTMGCNYLSLPEIPASGNKVLI